MAGVGELFALIHAHLAVTLRVNKIVSGLVLVVTGTGFASFVGSLNDSALIYARPVSKFEPVFGEALRDLPLVGPLVLGHDWVVYMSWVLVAVAAFWLFRTRRAWLCGRWKRIPPPRDSSAPPRPCPFPTHGRLAEPPIVPGGPGDTSLGSVIGGS
ncbi:MAG: hypothetical protein OXK16_04735 [bacterium]|nr:hypothetical protein [bacterium]